MADDEKKKTRFPMHRNKTAQDRMPTSQRPRVIQWQKRLEAMRGKA